MSYRRPYPRRDLITLRGLEPFDLEALLDRAEEMVALSRAHVKKRDTLRGRTQVNVFFEPSTRTQASFELAGKRLGADVMNMSVATSSAKKGETLLDTAATLNAMRPDLLVVRHWSAGAPALLAQKVDCPVINAGDGAHEHPTQALLDALTIRRAKGRIEGLKVAICGDVAHSRVARSNLLSLQLLGAETRAVAPPTLLPPEIERLGATPYTDFRRGIEGVDVIMMLRIQKERMTGAALPSAQEYFRFYGLDAEALSHAAPDAIVMHPGPMNRGVEISSSVADGPRSVIAEQVEMGVAVRAAVLETLAVRETGSASESVREGDRS